MQMLDGLLLRHVVAGALALGPGAGAAQPRDRLVDLVLISRRCASSADQRSADHGSSRLVEPVFRRRDLMR